jgi:hypothetical protein
VRASLTLFLVIIMLALTGCGKVPPDSEPSIEKIELIKESSEDQTDIITTYTEESSIQVIVEAIKSSTKLPGILDVAKPQYMLKLYYKNGTTQTYLLWISKSDAGYNGMIMNVEDTHVGYALNKDSAKALFKLIK